MELGVEPFAFSAKAVYVKDWQSIKRNNQGLSLGCCHDATHRVVTKVQAQDDRVFYDSDDELHRTVVHRDEREEQSDTHMKNDDSNDKKESVDDGRNFRKEDDLSTATQVCHDTYLYRHFKCIFKDLSPKANEKQLKVTG